MINTVKEQRDINTDLLTGYLVNSEMYVPLDKGNSHYQLVQEWIKEGNTPELAYTQDEREQYLLDKQVKEIDQAIQNHLDKKAQEFRYDNIMSARSYAGYANAFQEEATKLASWASDCWVKAGEIEADVKAGNRLMPTVDEVLSEMPIYA